MEALLALIGRHLFEFFGALALVGAGVMIFSRNAVHSVIGFLFAMLAIASCYLVLSAEFLAMAQMLVYAGGIVVLFLFVVMLVELDKYKERGVFQRQTPWVIGLVAAGALLFVGVFAALRFAPASIQPLTLRPELAQGLDVARQNAQAISRGLYADHLLPFEILSIILLVALVAAVVLAKTQRS